jgi:hypothetical protein
MSNIIVVVVVGGGGVPFFLRLYLCLWRSIYRFLPQQCEFLLFAHYNHYKPSKVIVEALCVDKSCSGGGKKCRWMRKNLRSCGNAGFTLLLLCFDKSQLPCAKTTVIAHGYWGMGESAILYIQCAMCSLSVWNTFVISVSIHRLTRRSDSLIRLFSVGTDNMPLSTETDDRRLFQIALCSILPCLKGDCYIRWDKKRGTNPMWNTFLLRQW